MSYLRRLIHSCDLYRPTTTKSASGQTRETLPGSATTSGLACLLQAGRTRRLLQVFGADLECDGMVFFPHGTDVRPKVSGTDGLNDRLKITTAAGMTEWLVVGVQEVALARQGHVVAAVKRSAT